MASMFFPLFIIASSIFFAGVAITLILTWMRSHRLIVRDPMNRKQYIETFWVTEKLDKKTHNLYWKSVFFQKSLTCPRPPAEAVNVGARGRKYAEAYRISEDEFVWITDSGITIKEKMVKDETTQQMVGTGKYEAYDIVEKKIEKDGKLVTVEKKIDSFKPFTAVQRDVLVNQYTKADDISKKRWSVGEIFGVISIGGMVMIIIVGFIFGADILKEHNNNLQVQNGIAAKQGEITNSLALLVRSLGIKVQDVEVTVAYAPKKQKSSAIVKSGEDPPE